MKRLVAVFAALVSVVLSAGVVLMGSLLAMAMVMAPVVGFASASFGPSVLAICLMATGAVNMINLPLLTDARSYANPRMRKAVIIANTLLLVIAAVMLFFGIGPIVVLLVGATALFTLFAVHLGREKPIPPGHCQWCGYDLTGLGGGICPECGADHPRTALDKAE